MMDINTAIDHLGLNANSYKLTQSVPPHSIVEWNGPDPQPTEAELEAAYTAAIAELALEQAKQQRATAYRNEADPLFFKAQRGEATIEEWQLKVAEIRSLYPYSNEEPAQ
jgi:hypothetical protein